MFGLPVGQYCDATGFDNRGWPMPFAAPEGTTRVDQLVICGAAQCQPGATIHAHVMEVTVDDPIPPSIALDGPLASGHWVSGRAAKPNVNVTASDNAGVKAIQVDVGGRGHAESYPCNLSQAAPCPTVATTVGVPSIGDLPDGQHTLAVYDV